MREIEDKPLPQSEAAQASGKPLKALSWSEYLANAPVASADFMDNVEDLPVQERPFLYSE